MGSQDSPGKGPVSQAPWPWQNFQDLNYKIRWDSGGAVTLPTKTGAVRSWLLREGCSTVPETMDIQEFCPLIPMPAKTFNVMEYGKFKSSLQWPSYPIVNSILMPGLSAQRN